MDFAFYRLVAAQHGVFTTAQALSHVTDAELRRHVRAGRWRRTRWRGVLVDGELPDCPALQLRAAALAAGADLVACHSTAAAVWGFGVIGDPTLHFLGPPQLVNRRLPGVQVHPSSLGTDDAVLVDGVWCTPPARTACDVVRTTAPLDGLATLDAALRSGTCTPADLVAAAESMRGLRQVARLRELVPHADAGAESPMESRMRWRFIDGGLPAPTVQVRLSDGGRTHHLDVGWEDQLVGAEFDGLEAHMTREQLAADRDRHNWLTEHRWTLLHVTAIDVYRWHVALVARTARALGVPFRPRS
ncbi:type IV toxin-antitoxin system AbiEi family antitoxin domain-containing protein [Geodermatophilus sp. SYSU D01105]